MKAMALNQVVNILEQPNPLELIDQPIPSPSDHEILLRVNACGVCHTELDEIEGRTPPDQFPRIPGHQVIGTIVQRGSQATQFKLGERVGVAWIFSACGVCEFCTCGQENLCPHFKATGRDADGGYAEYMVVPQGFAYPIPAAFNDAQAAPLLCAGAIGFRSLRLAGIEPGQKLGLTGFGASAHLMLKLVRFQYPDLPVYVFSRTAKERAFAKELGAAWSGDIGDPSPEKLDAIIDTTPVWKPVVEALGNLTPGGRLVINAIRKENIDQDYLMKLNYPSHLWMEKEIKSVANVTRQDVIEFLDIAAKIPIYPQVEEYPLEEANKALSELKSRQIRGAKVLKIS